MSADGFLRDICENTTDDAPRLIFADWLEDHGQGERAEFVRTQVKLARGRAGHGSAALALELLQLLEWEAALLEEHGAAWAREIAPLVSAYEFRGGFIEAVVVPAGRFVSDGARLRTLAPIREVRLTSSENPNLMSRHLGELAGCPHLAGVESLDLSYSVGRDGKPDSYPCYLRSGDLEGLLHSRYLDALHVLHLRGHADLALRELAASSRLSQLSAVELASYHTANAAEPILRSRRLGPDTAVVLRHRPEWLQGRVDLRTPGGWRTSLATTELPHETPTRRFSRRLHASLGSDPAGVVPRLTAALGTGHLRTRAAAALLLGWCGADAIPALPELIRRLYERDDAFGHDTDPAKCAAQTLGMLAPHIPEAARNFIRHAADPIRDASDVLTRLLEQPGRLSGNPDAVAEAVMRRFPEVVQRRANWRATHGRLPLRSDVAAMVAHDAGALREGVRSVVSQAQAAAARNDLSFELAEQRESAWLLARLCELALRA